MKSGWGVGMTGMIVVIPKLVHIYL